MNRKKILLCVAMVAVLASLGAWLAGCSSSSIAATNTSVTVAADKSSPTGYTATFVYTGDGTEQSVAFSGGFMFAKAGATDPMTAGSYVNLYKPSEWTKDMFPLSLPGNYGGTKFYSAMTKVSNTNNWTISLPLPSGGYPYQYVKNGVVKPADATHAYPWVDNYDATHLATAIADPGNLPIQHATAMGTSRAQTSSMVYVPFDAEKQAVDYSFVLPCTDGKKGAVLSNEYPVTGITYDDGSAGGIAMPTPQPLMVYLPYGYDSSRATPYKVIYLSHGAGGNEADWFNTNSVANIMDNLIAEGKTEPAIVVSMNNTVFARYAGTFKGDWYFTRLMNNQMNNIIPYIESHYNVSKVSTGRAYGGLSKGGNTASIMFYKHPKDFGYFGMLSGAYSGQDFDASDVFTGANIDLTGSGYNVKDLRVPKLFSGAGFYDNAFFNNVSAITITGQPASALGVYQFQALIGKALVGHQYKMVNGAHDCFVWPQLFKTWATEYLWK